MSLRSMTGYGRGVASGHGLHVEVEVSSVNRKQLDV
ncbi:MAG TPA: YicC/YloC family endoribonuclease, partial [Kiritimatiellia bacterium]